ncbi:S-layer homology domain-containing protein [Solibacillus sp. FSL R7-0668]|uniref:S-layer homology domain-containing protein n=1 Tax=Solibacillus sp. FSL R7-0668 TaxID=2921688 RepID=UPI0030FB7333
MKIKFYILVTVLTIGLLSASSIGANVSWAKSAADFTDLKDLDAATKAKFDAMISAGIFDGVSDNRFGLKDEMNRAQFAKVAALIVGLPVNNVPINSSFRDVTTEHYALPYIEAIRAAGITDGVGEGRFDPAGKVTKEQLATFLVRALGKQGEAQETPKVNDSTVSDWAAGYVQQALNLNLLRNSQNGTFGGKSNANRELLATAGFEAARSVEASKPIEVSGADFLAGNQLHLTLTVGVNANSVDLSKIMINGVPLDSKLNSFELSVDKKTIIIKLHEGFQLDLSKTPIITVNGLTTLYGNEVRNEASNVIPVKLTVPPVNSRLPAIPEPAPIPDTSSPEPNPEPGPPVEEPSPEPNPEPGPPVEEPNSEPNPESGPPVEETNPDPNQEPGPSVEEPSPEPNQEPEPSVEETNPDPNPESGPDLEPEFPEDKPEQDTNPEIE